MGVSLRLCRSDDGQRQLLESQKLRFPAWGEGMKLVRSLVATPPDRAVFAGADEVYAQHLPGRSWCLFSRRALGEHFDGLGWASATSSASSTSSAGSNNNNNAAELWGFVEQVAAVLFLMLSADRAGEGKGSKKAQKPAKKQKQHGKKQQLPPLPCEANASAGATAPAGGSGGGGLAVTQETSADLLAAAQQLLRCRIDSLGTGNPDGMATTAGLATHALRLLSHAYQVLLVEVLCVVDKDCRRTTAEIDVARKQLNSFSLSMRDKALRARVTPEQRNANKDLKAREARLSVLVQTQVAWRDRLLARVGNVVLQDRRYGLAAGGLLRTHGSPLTETDIIYRVQKVEPAASRHDSHVPQLSHHDLLHMVGGVDTRNAAAISGKRAYFLCGPAVFLSQALINYSLGFLADRGCDIVQPPEIMKGDMMARVAQLDDFDNNLYHVSRDSAVGPQQVQQAQHYLIATAEQPLCAMHFKQAFAAMELPRDIGGLSTCFRTEAGSHGLDTKGIFRVHQFQKVEQVTVAAPGTTGANGEPAPSERAFGRLLARTMEFYAGLGLSFQVVRCPFDELTQAAAVKYDIEAWFPHQGQFREVVSCSNCTDFQARALHMRMERGQRGKGGSVGAAAASGTSGSAAVATVAAQGGHASGVGSSSKAADVPHLLNSTLMANTRTIAAILETFSTARGVAVPAVLQPFMPRRFRHMIPFVNAPLNLKSDAQASRTAGGGGGGGGDDDDDDAWVQQDDGAWAFASRGSGGKPVGRQAGQTQVRPSDGAVPPNPDTGFSRYPLLLQCVHPKGVRFRSAPATADEAAALFKGVGPKGTKSASVVCGRRVDDDWFATRCTPASAAAASASSCFGSGNDAAALLLPSAAVLFAVHPGLQAGQELWLPARSADGAPNFAEGDRNPAAAEASGETSGGADAAAARHGGAGSHAGSPRDAPVHAVPGGERASCDAGFEKDPATEAAARRDAAVAAAIAANPHSWGLGVLYEERRLDGDQPFTREEFVGFYGGTAEWDAAPAHVNESAS